jgi:hypothetical protein
MEVTLLLVGYHPCLGLLLAVVIGRPLLHWFFLVCVGFHSHILAGRHAILPFYG